MITQVIRVTLFRWDLSGITDKRDRTSSVSPGSTPGTGLLELENMDHMTLIMPGLMIQASVTDVSEKKY